ncbi:hypothetical protein D3C75_1012280 [compost metagenome]
MRWADEQGMNSLLTRLERLQGLFGEHWHPARLIPRLMANGKRFADVGEGRV